MGTSNGKEAHAEGHGEGHETTSKFALDNTPFELYVKTHQKNPIAFKLMVHQCVVAIYQGNAEAVARNLSPEIVEQQFLRETGGSGNLIMVNHETEERVEVDGTSG